jgi:hypothetical protein
MLCRELTAADFFSVKVGVRKENMPAHHHTGASTLRLLSCTRTCNFWFYFLALCMPVLCVLSPPLVFWKFCTPKVSFP